VAHNPPQKEGLDDITGEPLVQREDDKEGTVRNRLSVYHEQTQPLVGFYKDLARTKPEKAPSYACVNGVGKLPEVEARLEEALA
jgi:adenylate kinase